MSDWNEGRVRTVEARLAALESNLQAVMAHLGLDWQEPAAPSGVDDEVLRLVQAGKDIEAIKRVRQLTGLGLAEAKTVVDGLRGY